MAETEIEEVCARWGPDIYIKPGTDPYTYEVEEVDGKPHHLADRDRMKRLKVLRKHIAEAQKKRDAAASALAGAPALSTTR